MRRPPPDLVSAVQRGVLNARTRREVLHYRGYFRTLDKDGAQTDDPNEIVRVEITSRARRDLGL